MAFTHKSVVNIYILSDIDSWSIIQGADLALGNSLFGAFRLIDNADPDKYKYSGYGIGFDARRSFSLSDGSRFGKYVTIFDMSLSVHIDTKKKDILILGKGATDGLDDTTLTAEKYSVNCTE